MNTVLYVAILLLLPLPAYAYLDPNAGGILFQILFPILVAIATGWALFKEKLRTLFRRRSKAGKPSPDKRV